MTYLHPKKLLSLSIFLSTFNFVQASSDSQYIPYGLWKTQNQNAKILIDRCSKNPIHLCGTIVETSSSQDKNNHEEKKDDLNPEESLRSRKIIGLLNLEGFENDPNNSLNWINGTIYSPMEGKTYSCTLTLKNPNVLEVYGYVGLPIFGKSQTWTRSTPEEKLLPPSKEQN